MKIELFKTPYKRPRKLSDPHNDFTEEMLNKIINTSDEAMGWWEFKMLFQVGLPAGIYQECCYFLPYALRYLALNAADGIECLSGIIWFISENTNNLARDNLLEKCIETMEKCFAIWTYEFTVVHYDKKACQEKHWCLEHDDIVQNSQIIAEALDELVYYQSQENIAFDFVEDIRISAVPIKSAWYLELSSSDNRYGFIRSEKLKKMLSDKHYLEKCANTVRQSSFMNTTSSPTYWNDVFERLNIA